MQTPITIATLVQAPAAPSGGGRAAALQLAPDVMHACKLGTGDLVLVRVLMRCVHGHVYRVNNTFAHLIRVTALCALSAGRRHVRRSRSRHPAPQQRRRRRRPSHAAHVGLPRRPQPRAAGDTAHGRAAAGGAAPGPLAAGGQRGRLSGSRQLLDPTSRSCSNRYSIYQRPLLRASAGVAGRQAAQRRHRGDTPPRSVTRPSRAGQSGRRVQVCRPAGGGGAAERRQ
jgi:hypothetical protein